MGKRQKKRRKTGMAFTTCSRFMFNPLKNVFSLSSVEHHKRLSETQGSSADGARPPLPWA